MAEPMNPLWLPDNWPNSCANRKDCSINCCNNGNGTSDSNMTTYSRPADCIANYGKHPDNKHVSETAIYTDVNLGEKLHDIKTFNNSNLCYASPGGDSSDAYEPIPYATTQLIQASIKNKAHALEPIDMPCWNQPPNPPPLPKEMATQMQYNIFEQNTLNEDHPQGNEGLVHHKTVACNHNQDHSMGGSHHSSDRGSNSTSGSQNQKKGPRAMKTPKHTAVSWGDALSPPHAIAWNGDEYSLPMEKSFDAARRTEGCPTPPIRGAASSPPDMSCSHQTATHPQALVMSNGVHDGINHLSSTPLYMDTDEQDEDAEEETAHDQNHHHLHRNQQHKQKLPHHSPHKLLCHRLEQTPASSTGELDRSVTGSMVNSWGSASEDNLSSGRSSIISTSDGSFFTDGDFSQAEGSRMCRYPEESGQRPSSPMSTDSNMSPAIMQKRPRRYKQNQCVQPSYHPKDVFNDDSFMPLNFPSQLSHSDSRVRGATLPRMGSVEARGRRGSTGTHRVREAPFEECESQDIRKILPRGKASSKSKQHSGPAQSEPDDSKASSFIASEDVRIKHTGQMESVGVDKFLRS